MRAQTPVRAVTLLTLIALVAVLFPLAGQAVTKAQVEEACADSRAQLEEYRSAQAAFEVAAHEYEDAVIEVDRVARKQESVAGSVTSHTDELDQIQTRIEEQAVELYMRGGLASPGIIFSASSVDEVMTTSEFLTTAATGGQESLDELVAARGELNRFQAVLDDTRVELESVEAQKLDARTNQEAAMEAEQAAYAKLSGRCKDLATEYDREQAELAARARQRAAGSVQVGSFICPFTPGRTSFIDSWGASRSGG
ncbi:MAG: coiled-coil domain-containing protein, partial [Acidimicrobiia bacterium]